MANTVCWELANGDLSAVSSCVSYASWSDLICFLPLVLCIFIIVRKNLDRINPFWDSLSLQRVQKCNLSFGLTHPPFPARFSQSEESRLGWESCMGAELKLLSMK